MTYQLNITREQFITEWVAALRSGAYPQTPGCLQDPTGFCCLGVACDIAAKHGGSEWDYTKREQPTINGEWGCVTAPMAAFIRGEGPPSICGDLVHMNDELRKTFDEIAAFIEEKLL